jgi:molybdenum cofactor synthesis domain-containing protein
VSDRSARGEREDASGPVIRSFVEERWQWTVAAQQIVPDERDVIRATLIAWCDDLHLNLILTTGGTGFAPRDVTPEATQDVIERAAPGLAEAMRQASLSVTPHAMLSRATAGIRKRTLIVNLPGSPRAAVENLSVITPVLPHAVQLLSEDPQAEASHRPASS